MAKFSSYKEKEMYEMNRRGYQHPCEDDYYWVKKKKCDCKEKDDHQKKCNCKEKDSHKKKDKKKNKTLTDFAYDTLDPNVEEDNVLELTADVQVPVATVTLDQVKKGGIVWLNGVFGLDNDNLISERTVFMRIYKGSPSVFIPGQEIYRARIEIDNSLDDDNVVEPLSHVDKIINDEKHVTYTVTLEATGDDVFLNGPVTFTAALITK